MHGAFLRSLLNPRDFSLLDMSGIAVHVRVRPNTNASAWATADTVVYATERPESRFAFNKVHSTAANNATLFHSIEPLMHSAFDGRNVTIMAYGQTGSGKTHTMVGTAKDGGIISRAVNLLLDLAKGSPGTVLQAGCCEIYNETVRDLMAGPGQNSEVQLYDGVDNMVTFDRMNTPIKTYSDFVVMSSHSQSARKQGVTNLNDHSSRSHMILAVRIQRPNRPTPSIVYFVDLAGSESASKANTEGNALREGGFINKSLLTLGNVVDAIVENRGHVPYRESKLTRLLRPCLGGNGLTFIVTTVNPEPQHYDQTCTALRFAQRAMKMKGDPTQTVTMIPLTAYEYAEYLKRQLENFKKEGELAYERGIAETMKYTDASVTARANFLNTEIAQAASDWNKIKLMLIAREKLKAVLAARNAAGRAQDCHTRQCEASAAEQRERKRLHELRQESQDYIMRCEKLGRAREEKLLEKKRLEEAHQFGVDERMSNMYTPFDAICDKESVAREQILLDEAKEYFEGREAILSKFRSTNFVGSRQERIHEMRRELVKERRDVEDLEAAYEMIGGDTASVSSGPSVHSASNANSGKPATPPDVQMTPSGAVIPGIGDARTAVNDAAGFATGTDDEPNPKPVQNVADDDDDVMANEKFDAKIMALESERQGLQEVIVNRERNNISASPLQSTGGAGRLLHSKAPATIEDEDGDVSLYIGKPKVTESAKKEMKEAASFLQHSRFMRTANNSRFGLPTPPKTARTPKVSPGATPSQTPSRSQTPGSMTPRGGAMRPTMASSAKQIGSKRTRSSLSKDHAMDESLNEGDESVSQAEAMKREKRKAAAAKAAETRKRKRLEKEAAAEARRRAREAKKKSASPVPTPKGTPTPKKAMMMAARGGNSEVERTLFEDSTPTGGLKVATRKRPRA